MYLEKSLGNQFVRESSTEAFLRTLVEIDSQVGNQKGILKVQNLLKNKLEQLGFITEYVVNTYKDTAPLLIARKKALSNRPTISFIGHADVVTSPMQNGFKIEADKIIGSGVADDKGGLVVCLKAVEDFLASILELNINLNIVISPNEETGSIGFHSLFRQIGSESDYVLGLEPALKCGSLISSRSGNRWYQFSAQGIAAHAGRFGHNHINAAHKLSLLIAQMHELNNEKELRRVNVGSFEGGSGGFNTICDRAQAKVDVRFSSFKCRDYLHKEIESIMHQSTIKCPYSDENSKVFYSIEDDCPPLDGKISSVNYFKSITESINRLESVEVNSVHAGGAADINYFAHPNKRLLDGLGPIGGGLHTKHEYIERKSILTRSKAVELFLHEINQSYITIGR